MDGGCGSAATSPTQPLMSDNYCYMSRFLKRDREELKHSIFSKLGLTKEESEEAAWLQRDSETGDLDRVLKQTEQKKLSIRKAMLSSDPQADFTQEMAQLRWRIDVLRQHSRPSNRLPNPQTSSITGKRESGEVGAMDFEEMYKRQKEKFGALRQRRNSKTSNASYIEMLGKMEARRESRKNGNKGRVEAQMASLSKAIEG